MPADMGEVSIWATFLSRRWQIIKVVFSIARGKLNILEWEFVEVPLRNKPRFVGTIDAAGQKERSVVFLAKLVTDPFRHEPIATEFFIRRVERHPNPFRHTATDRRAADSPGVARDKGSEGMGPRFL